MWEYIYIAFFVDRDELLKKCEGIGTRLNRVIDNPHVTLIFHPQFAHKELFGKTARIRVTGYGNDGKNDGVCVEVSSVGDPALKEMVDAVETPHITISVSEDGKPANTRFLDFAPVDGFEITGVFGGFVDGEAVLETP